MARYYDADELPRLKFHPLPYTHITPADIKDAEAYERGWNDAIDAIIENAPTADVRENVHGNWSYCEKYDDYKCSACGQHSLGRYNFCPDCGAVMDASEEPTMEEYMYGQEGSEEDGSL